MLATSHKSFFDKKRHISHHIQETKHCPPLTIKRANTCSKATSKTQEYTKGTVQIFFIVNFELYLPTECMWLLLFLRHHLQILLRLLREFNRIISLLFPL